MGSGVGVFQLHRLSDLRCQVAATIGKGIIDPKIVDHCDLRRAIGATAGTSSPGHYDPVEFIARADWRPAVAVAGRVHTDWSGFQDCGGDRCAASFRARIILMPRCRGARHAAPDRPLVPQDAAGICLLPASVTATTQKTMASFDAADCRRRRSRIARGWCSPVTARALAVRRLAHRQDHGPEDEVEAGEVLRRTARSRAATGLGVPVSTTHTITGAIVGVGSARKVSAVRWGVAGNIVWAWVFTIPCSAFVAAFAWWLAHLFL